MYILGYIIFGVLLYLIFALPMRIIDFLRRRKEERPMPPSFLNSSFMTFVLIIFIFAILGAILVPCFITSRSQSQWTACQSNLKNLATALEMYAEDNRGHYPTSLAQLTPKYITNIPTCPSVGTATYTSSYTYSTDPDAFTLYCNGRNHDAVGAGENHPQYSSSGGLFAK